MKRPTSIFERPRGSLLPVLLIALAATGCAGAAKTAPDPAGGLTAEEGMLLPQDLSGTWWYTVTTTDTLGVPVGVDTLGIQVHPEDAPMPPRRDVTYDTPTPEEVRSALWVYDFDEVLPVRFLEATRGLYLVYGPSLDSSFLTIPALERADAGQRVWVNNPGDIMRVHAVYDSLVLGQTRKVVEVDNYGPMIIPCTMRWAVGLGLVYYSLPADRPQVNRTRGRMGQGSITWTGRKRIYRLLRVDPTERPGGDGRQGSGS